MRRATTIAATVASVIALAAVLSACDRSIHEALDPSATRSAPPAVRPLSTGRALLALDGDERDALVFGVLTEPATYAGGEGPLSLVWRTSSYELFTLGGTIRRGEQPTSEALRVQLAIDVGGSLGAFASDDGSCRVTVERATRRAIAGRIACEDLRDPATGTTVDVEGTFQAAGQAAGQAGGEASDVPGEQDEGDG